MIDLIGRRVAVVQSSDHTTIGLRGIFALETMKTITILSEDASRRLPKLGTVLQAHDGGKLFIGNEMVGRIEDRIARGAKV